MLAFSALLQRPIRQDPWDQIGRATIHLVRERLAAGDVDGSVELLQYAEREYRTIREIYARWNREMVDYLVDQAPGTSLEAVFRATLLPWVHLLLAPVLASRPFDAGAASETTPLILEVEGAEAHLRFPDGAPALRVVPVEGRRYVLQIGGDPPVDEAAARRLEHVVASMRRGDAAAVDALLDAHVRYSRAAHDILADWAWALLSHGYRSLGESRMEEMQRVTLGRWVTERYGLIGQMSMAEQAQLTIEGMRGHFCGPGRQGDVEVVEETDRWVISFDPCGSGGRMRRGDPLNHTPPRSEAPFHFVHVEGAHPWTWGKKGVCLYCSHCAIVNEILPIETVGYPMRVTENPTDPGDKCRWIVYKRPELVPEEAYRRVGKVKPASLRREG